MDGVLMMAKTKRIFTLLVLTLSISFSIVPTLALERITAAEPEVSMRAVENEMDGNNACLTVSVKSGCGQTQKRNG